MKKLVKTIFVTALVFSLHVALSQQASAWDAHRMRDAPLWGEQLSPAQRIAAQKIIDEGINNTAPIRQSLSNKYSELNALLSMNAPDNESIEKLSREIGELRGKLLEERIKTRENMRKQGLPEGYFGSAGIHGGRGNWKSGFYHSIHTPRKSQNCRHGRELYM